jgi:hypothetical protein
MLILLILTKSVCAYTALLRDRADMIRQEANLNYFTDIIPTYIKDRGMGGDPTVLRTAYVFPSATQSFIHSTF